MEVSSCGEKTGEASASASAAAPAPVGKKEQYEVELAELLRSVARKEEDEPDFELGLEEAAIARVPEGGGGGESSFFPEALTPFLARHVQGRGCPLSVLVSSLSAALKARCGATVSAEALASKIRLVAERKAYGASRRSCVIHEDTSPRALWRWEVASIDLFEEAAQPAVKEVRSLRTKVGLRVKALTKLCDALAKDPTDAAKISHEEERYVRFKREEEAARLKALARERKRLEKEAEAERKRKKKEDLEEKKKEHDEAKRKKEEEKAKKEEARQKKEHAEKKQAASFMGFFVKKTTATSPKDKAAAEAAKAHPEPSLSSTLPDMDLEKIQRPEPVTLDDLRTMIAEASTTKNEGRRRRKRDDDLEDDDDRPEDDDDGDDDASVVVVEEKKKEPAARFFYFHDEYRGGHWDASNRTSTVVTGTDPFAVDPDVDYDYDSDAEFAVNDAEVEDGEDIENDDDDLADDDADGADYEVDDFLCADDDDDGEDKDKDKDENKADRESKQKFRRQVIVGPVASLDDDDGVPDDLKAYRIRLYVDPKDIKRKKKGEKEKTKRGGPAAQKKKKRTSTTKDEPPSLGAKRAAAQKSITSFFAAPTKKPKTSPPSS